MKQRILSGLMLVAFCVAIVLLNNVFPLALNIVVALISVASVQELINALGVGKKWFLSIPSVITAGVVPFVSGNYQLLVYALFTLVLFGAMVFYHRETTFREVAVLYSMAIMIPSALRCLVSLRDLSPEHGIYYPMVAVFAAWVADAGAYFAGTFFGKHRMCPEISPKKTWEGAVGGCIINVIFIVLSGVVLAAFYGWTPQPGYLALFIVGLFGSPISILGDLSFSLIKRSCHIKDFGEVIPGHGGILDRFDSVIFTAPFVYLVALWMPLIVG